MKAWRVPVAIVILSVVGAAGWWWWGRNHAPTALKKIIPGQQPGTTMADSNLIWWEKGEKVCEIHARKVWRSKDGNIAVLEDISNSKIYYEDEEITIEAPLARLDQIQQIITVSGGVTARLKKGHFETESIRIDKVRNTMVSGGKILFRYDGADITADLLQGDLEKEIYRLVGNVIVQEGTQILKGKELEYNLQDETYTLLDGTEVEFEL